MRSLKLILPSATLAACLLFAACSKNEGAGSATGSGSVLDNTTVSYLPETTIGFITWDTQSSSYQKLKASSLGKQWSKSYDLIKQAEATADEESKKFFKIYDGLVETGLWTKSPEQKEVLGKAVAFVDIDPGTKLPQAAFYAAGVEGQNIAEKITAIQKVINAQGIKTNPENIGGSSGFSIAMDEAAKAGSPITKVLVVASANKLAITTNQALAAKYFSDKPDNGILKIKESNEFKKATQGVNSSDSSMSFAFFDVNKLVKGLESLGASTGVDAGANDLKDIPVESLAASSSMDASLSSVLSVSLSPKNDMQKNIISSFAASGQNQTVAKVPGDLMVLLSLDGGTIKSLKGAALMQAPPGSAEMMQPVLDLIDSIKSLSIGIRGASGATPFPELLVLANSTKAPEIEKNLKMQLEGAMASSGMPIPWNQKDVGDAKLSYAVTPFGVGAYLTSINDMVILTSAEKLVSDMIASSKSDGKSLLTNLSQPSKDLANDSKSLFMAYSDFNKVGDAILAAQDSLAMFTGGKGSIPADQIESIKQMGSVFLSLNLDNNLVKIQSNYEPPAKG